jgi:hypothetical protein
MSTLQRHPLSFVSISSPPPLCFPHHCAFMNITHSDTQIVECLHEHNNTQTQTVVLLLLQTHSNKQIVEFLQKHITTHKTQQNT